MGIEIHDGIELWKVRLFDPNTVMRSGAYHGISGTNAYPLGRNLLVAQYWPLYRGATFDRIAVNVQTADSGKELRLGIYADADLDGYPDRLLLDAGTVDLSTAGAKWLDIDVYLEAGLYFLALLSDSATAAIWMDDLPKCRSPLGMHADPGLPVMAWRVACNYGPLPDPYPQGAVAMNDAYGVALRVGRAY